jgi:hypothetical protein
MKTQITLVDGATVELDDEAVVKMTEHGIEVTEREGDETVRVTFPWSRIDRVTQRGPEVGAIYTY